LPPQLTDVSETQFTDYVNPCTWSNLAWQPENNTMQSCRHNAKLFVYNEQLYKMQSMTCRTKLPATTAELVLVFHSCSGVAAAAAGAEMTGCCCTLAHIGCTTALRSDARDTTTDDSGDATLITGCGSDTTACDVDGTN